MLFLKQKERKILRGFAPLTPFVYTKLRFAQFSINSMDFPQQKRYLNFVHYANRSQKPKVVECLARGEANGTERYYQICYCRYAC